ncbi:CHAT domain-containing protein [Bradyrhizobium sp. WSM471]|uniref:CHAT domain-containing protein n=1 Tax=Bradyrhizobium sp. WSM471 TaxID=319017 RepID=UPI00024D1B9D|nr:MULTISPECIES: CHAT domain-containing protein [Bradyrhizobium]EHR00249.1 hypothetical protein Bra471DRAFT_00809 [Bradyrhizobium sp. WSM471]UFW42368.1 CHAT domain-containing protein [Bradyrhizobium canariense]
MHSLWLRVEQLDRDNGRVALFDAPFPAEGTRPVIERDFSLASIGSQEWTDRAAEMASGGPSITLFEDFGTELFRLLNQDVVAEWERRREFGTRTYLQVKRNEARPAYERQLVDLPWEYLARKLPGGLVERYFSDPDRPMLRTQGAGRSPGPLSCQLNILVIAGEVVDWENGGFPGDDAVAVLREFQRSESLAHAELLQAPSLETLEGILDRLNPDIVHFSGHGELHPETQRPALKFNKPGEPTWWWDTDGIRTVFHNRTQKPRLVVLNACDTAQASGHLYSILETLMSCGITAVIAAQAPIRQAVTSELSQAFYRELLQDKPVDVALTKARYKIGQRQRGAGWRSRDWGLPVLSVSIAPEDLFPPRPALEPDPIQILRRCAVLRKFMRNEGLPAPFVGLGWMNQRFKAIDALRRSHCLVIKGPPKGGKSWLVMRTLRDAVQIGHRVKYVSVCGERSPAMNYVKLLSAIIDPDRTQVGSEVHGALDGEAFKEFVAERDAASSVERIVEAFERGLQEITKTHQFTIVLDQFQREAAVSESFPAAEFRAFLLPLWLRIAQGAVKNLRLITVVRDELYDSYGLAALPDEPIELSLFRRNDVPMLFQELCRFYRGGEIPTLHKAALILVKDSQWDATKLEFLGQLVEQAAVEVT